jgi:hypothetical protein
MAYNPNPRVSFGDSASVDAFSRARVSQNNLLFSSSFIYDKRPLIWSESLTGASTSTLQVNRASVTLGVTGAGDRAILQTKRYFRYLSGQSQAIFVTFAAIALETNVTKRVGYFDDANGLFLEAMGGTLSLVRRSSVTGSTVDTAIPQASWNIDTFDGSGPSGKTLDPTKAQILVIDFQWLGVGRVRMGFDIDGVVYYAHEFLHANIVDSVYMGSPTLPIRYEISTTGGAGSFEAICSAVSREGGLDDSGIITTLQTPLNQNNATTTLRSILAVRLRPDHIRGSVLPLSAAVNTASAGFYNWQLILNPTVAGSFTWANEGVGLQKALDQLVVTEGTGHLVQAGFVEDDFGTNPLAALSDLFLSADVDGNADVLVLAVRNAGGTDDVNGTVTVLEQYT